MILARIDEAQLRLATRPAAAYRATRPDGRRRAAYRRDADDQGQRGRADDESELQARGVYRRDQPRKKLLRKKSRFAGRSASRRMRYGYHSGPKGTEMSTRCPACASST